MDILKNIQFLKLWGNQVLLQISFNMANFTALLLINSLSGSRFAQAQFYAALTLPAFLVGLFAGSIVDLVDRKRLMLLSDIFLAILFFGYAVFNQSHWALILIAFLTASIAQFFTPAEAATIPAIVPEKDLEHANSLFLFTALGSVMIGYALSGPIITAFGGLQNGGVKATFILAGILTALGFLLRLSLKTIDTLKPINHGQTILLHAIRLTGEVIKLLQKEKKIYVPVALLTAIEFNIGMLAIIFIDYVKKYLALPSTSTSTFLVIPLILGLGLGSVLLGPIQKRVTRANMIFLACLLFGLILSGLSLSGLFFVDKSLNLVRNLTLAGAFLSGISIVIVAVLSRTILQENTPEEMLGRVFSLVTISSSAVTPIPILLVALITDKLDVAIILLSLGIAVLLGALVFRKALVRALN